jgi:protein TonB
MDFAQQQRNPARHLLGIAFVIIFHVLLIYALVNGLAQRVVDVIKKPVEVKIVEEVKPPPPPPQNLPPPPKLTAPPPPFIPPPEVSHPQRKNSSRS